MSAHWMFTLAGKDTGTHVPGSSRWVAGHLKECDFLASKEIKSIHRSYEEGIGKINSFLENLDLHLNSDEENSIIAEKILRSPGDVSTSRSGDPTASSNVSLDNRSFSHNKTNDRSESADYRGTGSTKATESTVADILPKTSSQGAEERRTEASGPAGTTGRHIITARLGERLERPAMNSSPPKVAAVSSDIIRREIVPVRRESEHQIIIPSSSPRRSTFKGSPTFSRHSQFTAPTGPITITEDKDVLASVSKDAEQEAEEEADISLQKIQMSIRRTTDVRDKETVSAPSGIVLPSGVVADPEVSGQNSSILKTPKPLPTKTPIKTPAFVSLPKREPLTIESSVANRKSLATISREKRQTNSSSVSKSVDSTSPMRRNRFPSFIEDNSTKTPLPSHRATTIVNSTNVTSISPQRRLNDTKTPQLYTRQTFTSSAPKPQFSPVASKATRSPARSPVAAPPISSVAQSSKLTPVDQLVPKDTGAVAPRFMSPTGSSMAKSFPNTKTMDYTSKSKSKFMTTTLGPNTRLSRHAPRAKSPTKANKIPEQKSVENGKLTLDSKKIPPLTKRSLTLPRNEVKPKVVVATKPKTSVAAADPLRTSSARATTSRPSNPNLKRSLSRGGAEAAATPGTNPYYKRRRLGGNGVALPEAARPKPVMKLKDAKATIATTLEPDQTRAPPEQKVDVPHGSSSPFLPDIGSDDESGVVLKTWAEPSNLHQLVIQSKQMNPKEIFGEVTRVDAEAFR